MVEFLRKFESHDIKIVRVNWILITKSINLLYFCTVLGSVVIEGDFPCLARPSWGLGLAHLQRSLRLSKYASSVNDGWLKAVVQAGEQCP